MRFAERLEPYRDTFLDLEYSASEPYSSFVYGTREKALEISRLLFSEQCGEFMSPHARLLLDDQDRPLGLAAFLTARDLGRSRFQAAFTLRRSGLLSEETSERVRLAAPALMKLQPQDFYFSRLSVVEGARRQGIGSELIEHFLKEGGQRGCQRAVLEVTPIHEAAVRLYGRHRFVEVAHQAIQDSSSGRSLDYIHMARDLS